MKRLGLSVLFGVLVVGFVASAEARHRRYASDESSGVFDYYLLSLSWSPAYCLESPNAAECNGPRRYGFIVHGLWPQNERGWPEHCGGDSRVPEGVVLGIADLMPARGLVFHEWSTHGTCSGLDPSAYFGLVRRAYESLAIPPILMNPTAAVEQSPSAIASAYLKANPRLPPRSIVVSCTRQGAPRLREVHVCFDRVLNPRACSAQALHEACRAPSIIVPPIR